MQPTAEYIINLPEENILVLASYCHLRDFDIHLGYDLSG